jgi:hypothetical protein
MNITIYGWSTGKALNKEPWSGVSAGNVFDALG